MKTGLITSETYQYHDTGPGHPEQIARVTVINENFKKFNNKNILWKKPYLITEDIIKDTHDTKYVDLIKNSFPTKGFCSLDGDTIISPGSKQATFDAAGSIIAAIDGVQNKEFKNALCNVRPPGHHANQNKAAISNGIGKAGEVLSNKLEIACNNNQSIKILEIQRQGKKSQKIDEFMLGSQIKKGSVIKNV